MNISRTKMEEIMEQVIKEVDVAIKEGNAPFSAFLLDKNGNILFKEHNTTNSELNPTAHAEINLIRKACQKLQTKDLSDYILISNAWSCSMCMSASVKAKIENYIFGAKSESNMNPNITIFDIQRKSKNKLNIITGVLEQKCIKQIEDARKKVK